MLLSLDSWNSVKVRDAWKGVNRAESLYEKVKIAQVSLDAAA